MLKKLLISTIILSILLGLGIYAVFFKHLLPQEPKKYPPIKQVVKNDKPNGNETTPSQKVQAITSLTGIINMTERPSPEIPYDYIIKLTTPVYEEAPGGGRPQPVYNYILVADNDTVWSQLENYIGKSVKVTGEVEMGLAETRHFLVTKVEGVIK